MTASHKKAWTCQTCHQKNKENSTKNEDQHSENFNVTLRKKASQYQEQKSLEEEDLTISPGGNTLNAEGSGPETCNDMEYSPPSINENQPVTLRQMNILLQQNNKYIIREMRKTIEDQIEIAIHHIKEEFKLKNEKIQIEQTEIKQNIDLIDQKIMQIDSRCHKFQMDSEKLQKEIQKLKENTHQMETNENYDKIFVLHGLPINYWETEEDLIGKISNIFYEILELDISGYIDEISYIGRKGTNKPIKIELINKRMTKYILENSIYFKGTGLSVTEYLSKPALQERRHMIQALQSARKNGNHAIIRNNKLFVNGKETLLYDNNEKYKNSHENINDTENQLELEKNKPKLDTTNKVKNSEKVSNSLPKPTSSTQNWSFYQQAQKDPSLSNHTSNNNSFRY